MLSEVDNVVDIQPIEEDALDPQEEERRRKMVPMWLKRIDKEQEVHEDYRKSAQDAWAVALNDVPGYEVYYPLLWTVSQVQSAAIYSGAPIPDIRARNTSDRNKQFKHAAQVMQRALEFYLDQTSFDANMGRTINDYLIAACGVPRVKIDTEIIEGQPILDEMGMDTEEFEEEIGMQVVRLEHVPWDQFGWEPVSNWDHCDWVYYAHEMPPKQVKKRWGVDITASDREDAANRKDKNRRSRTNPKTDDVQIYEIWCKVKREVIVIAEGHDMPLEVTPDPLGMMDFFPSPQPAFTNLAPDELIPTTDYTYIESFDKELQRLYKRRRAIVEQIKAASLHDSSLVEIEDWKTIEDGDSVPVDHLQERMDGGADLRKVIMFWPNEERIATIKEITQQIMLIRQQVDEMLGISDVLRGSSNPQDGQETNKIKERWAGIRLRPKQLEVQRIVRDVFRMMAELTVEHVTPDNLAAMTQMEVNEEITQILRNDLMREFSIDVETDSTVAKDEMAERTQRTELLQGIVQYVQVVAPAVAQKAIPADLAREILQIATDPYKKYSRGLDDVIEQLPSTMQQLGQANAQIGQMTGALQQKDKEIQEKDYSLAQYSQADEQRKTMESQGKVAKDMSTAQKNTGAATLDQVKAMLTQVQTMVEEATIGNVQADTGLKQAQTVDTLRPDPGPTAGEQ